MTKIFVIVAVLVIIGRVGAWCRSRALGPGAAAPAVPAAMPGVTAPSAAGGADLSQRFREVAQEMRAGNTSRAMALLSRRDTDWDAVRAALDATIRSATALGLPDPAAVRVAAVLAAPGGQNILIDEIVRTATPIGRLHIVATLERVTTTQYLPV